MWWWVAGASAAEAPEHGAGPGLGRQAREAGSRLGHCAAPDDAPVAARRRSRQSAVARAPPATSVRNRPATDPPPEPAPAPSPPAPAPGSTSGPATGGPQRRRPPPRTGASDAESGAASPPAAPLPPPPPTSPRPPASTPPCGPAPLRSTPFAPLPDRVRPPTEDEPKEDISTLVRPEVAPACLTRNRCPIIFTLAFRSASRRFLAWHLHLPQRASSMSRRHDERPTRREPTI